MESNVNIYPEVLSNGHILDFFQVSNLKEVLVLLFISVQDANTKVPK